MSKEVYRVETWTQGMFWWSRTLICRLYTDGSTEWQCGKYVEGNFLDLPMSDELHAHFSQIAQRAWNWTSPVMIYSSHWSFMKN